MKTKIAYVIPTLSLGGAEKQQINILNGMDSERFEIKLYVLKNKIQLLPQLKNKNIEVEICNIDSFKDMGAFYRFIKDIKKFNPDIIHSQMYNANVLVRFLKLLLPKSKIVNHFHGMSQWMSKPKLLLDKSTSFLVSKFIVVSQKSFDLRLKREKYSKEKMEVLFNSVDLQPIEDVQKNKEVKTVTIGMASRLIPLKNIEGAMFMLSELHKKGFDFNLTVAGDGVQKEILVDYAQKLGISDRVTFLGFVSNMESFYSQIDIYCISSFTEDLPLSIVEAMMAGKPVLASNVGGIPGILNNVPCTLLVNDFFDSEEINMVSNFLEDMKIKKCKDKLVEYAVLNFDNKAYCERLANIYAEMLGKN